MSGVEIRTVGEDEVDLRLDRWFGIHFPELGHGRLQKLLRTGQVRVDGRRAKAGLRLAAGAQVRVPPLGAARTGKPPKKPEPTVSPADADFIKSLVLHKDEDAIALNKPPGLAVQGGTGTHRHIDGMLDALRFDAKETPRLVHRLDRDTSGVLLLGRSRPATAALGKTFRSRSARKLYWAVTVGVPELQSGRIDLPIAKLPGPAGGAHGRRPRQRPARHDGIPRRRAHRHPARLGRAMALDRPYASASGALRRDWVPDFGRRKIRRFRRFRHGPSGVAQAASACALPDGAASVAQGQSNGNGAAAGSHYGHMVAVRPGSERYGRPFHGRCGVVAGSRGPFCHRDRAPCHGRP